MGAGKPKGKSKTPHAKSAYGAPGGAAEACPNVAAKRKAGPSASLGMTIFCGAVMVGRFCLAELSGAAMLPRSLHDAASARRN
jgi:hypothetical protein